MKEKLASILIRILAGTWRYTVQGKVPEGYAVIAFWHGEMLPVWKFYAGKKVAGVTSLSKDGDILAQLLKDWGYVVLRGSSSRGGKEVLEEMVTHAQQRPLLVTPDGPRGPAGVFKAGALVAAQRAAVPLCMVRVECSRYRRLEKSWDRFLIPMPFARVILHFNSTVQVPPTASRDDIDAVRQSMNIV